MGFDERRVALFPQQSHRPETPDHEFARYHSGRATGRRGDDPHGVPGGHGDPDRQLHVAVELFGSLFRHETDHVDPRVHRVKMNLREPVDLKAKARVDVVVVQCYVAASSQIAVCIGGEIEGVRVGCEWGCVKALEEGEETEAEGKEAHFFWILLFFFLAKE